MHYCAESEKIRTSRLYRLYLYPRLSMRTLPGKPYCCLSQSTWTFCALAFGFCSAYLQILRCCFRNMLVFETCFAFVCILILLAWIVPRKPSCPRFFNSPNPTAEDDAFAVMETVAAEETGCFLEPSLFKAKLDPQCELPGGCDMMTDLQNDTDDIPLYFFD